jgi:hypothetical protein
MHWTGRFMKHKCMIIRRTSWHMNHTSHQSRYCACICVGCAGVKLKMPCCRKNGMARRRGLTLVSGLAVIMHAYVLTSKSFPPSLPRPRPLCPHTTSMTREDAFTILLSCVDLHAGILHIFSGRSLHSLTTHTHTSIFKHSYMHLY